MEAQDGEEVGNDDERAEIGSSTSSMDDFMLRG